MATAADAETERAQRLLEAARSHKRAARRHRERSAALMTQLDQLVQAAAARGIEIRINTAEPKSGGHSGNRAGTEDIR